MKAIILAAGQGQRLMPLTADRPKCMVEYRSRPLIDYTLDTLEQCGVRNVVVNHGYLSQVLEKHLSGRNIRFCFNSRFSETNMVHTLFCAEHEMDDDLIISYSDIFYHPHILQSLIEAEGDVLVTADKDWRKQWEARFANPLSDAETFKVKPGSNTILELGKKPSGYEDIEGQYIGLIKISRKVLPHIVKFYHSLDQSAVYDGKSFDNMFMTTFLQLIIDRLMPVQVHWIYGSWLEFDTVNDLNNA